MRKLNTTEVDSSIDQLAHQLAHLLCTPTAVMLGPCKRCRDTAFQVMVHREQVLEFLQQAGGR